MMEKYLGTINVGDRFLLEVESSQLIHVAVVEIKRHAGAAMICSRTLDGKDEMRWTEEERFRARCFWIGEVD